MDGGTLPADVARKFNWGAFYFTWIWGLNHKAYITLLVFVLGCVPYLGSIAHIGFAIWIGTKGNQMAWDSGRFRSIDEMMECQRIWAKWALWVFIATFSLILIVFIIAAATGAFNQVR